MMCHTLANVVTKQMKERLWLRIIVYRKYYFF